MSDWIVETHNEYIIISRKDKPGEIHIKMENDGYITDIVTNNGEVIGGGWASYNELDDGV